MERGGEKAKKRRGEEARELSDEPGLKGCNVFLISDVNYAADRPKIIFNHTIQSCGSGGFSMLMGTSPETCER